MSACDPTWHSILAVLPPLEKVRCGKPLSSITSTLRDLNRIGLKQMEQQLMSGNRNMSKG